jgi:DNA-binding response OmpR family regulator
MAQNIIIIDDNRDNIKLASLILQKEGYTVFSELSVKSGIKTMKEHKMSLILLDIMMPGVDGLEGIKLIKEDEELRCIPILMMTAISTKDYVLKALDAGADDYLSKPYNIKDLTGKTKHLVSISTFIKKWCTKNSESENIIVLD